jgi:hypothetical protein
MNRAILNNLPFPRTTRYLASISTKEMYYQIKVKLIVKIIDIYVFDKENDYHVEKVIGHLHRKLNKDYHDISWGDKNFLLLSIRNDLDDSIDIINAKECEEKKIDSHHAESDDVIHSDDDEYDRFDAKFVDKDDEIISNIDKVMHSLRNSNFDDTTLYKNMDKVTQGLKDRHEKRVESKISEKNMDFHGRY